MLVQSNIFSPIISGGSSNARASTSSGIRAQGERMTALGKRFRIFFCFAALICSAVIFPLIPSTANPPAAAIAEAQASVVEKPGTSSIETEGRIVALCSCLGDLNGDFLGNGRDIQQFVRCLLGPTLTASPCFCADMDSDGRMTVADIPPFVATLLSGSPCTSSQTGACCLPTNGCINTTLQMCTAQGGTFSGQGIPCSPT